MDSNLLKIFVTVAQESSISLGAKKLGYAQSNVTSRIKQLEKVLGCTLFHRVPKGVILTNEGKKLYYYAQQVLKKIDITMKNMKDTCMQQSISVGITTSISPKIITSFLKEVYEKHSNINLEIETNTTENIITSLLDYQIDIAFIDKKINNENLLILKQFKEKIVIVEKKEKIKNNTYLTFKDECGIKEHLQNYLLEYDHKEDYQFIELNSYEIILECLKEGVGKSIVPFSLMKNITQKKELNITSLDKSYSHLSTSLICKKDYIPKIIYDLIYENE